MPVQPEEVLKELTAAVNEAKRTKRELHEARAAFMQEWKNEKEAVIKAVTDAVDEAVEGLRADSRVRMHFEVKKAVDEFAALLRSRLGL